MKRSTIANLLGLSSTGSTHGLLIETEADGSFRFTVTGHDGKKRHAAVILPASVVFDLTESLAAVLLETPASSAL